MTIRPTSQIDLPAIAEITEQAGLFPPEMLSEPISGYPEEDGSSIWFTALSGDQVIGFCYAVPEMLAEGAWNLLAIGVSQAEQREGHGAGLMRAVEAALKATDQRILIVDTSSHGDFERARRFYLALGYEHEATIRDFWAEGDNKITFRKAL